MSVETHLAQADALRLPLADQSVDLVFGSPPYVNARLYLEDGRDLGIARDAYQWVAWMLDVTREAVRVSRGMVCWVCAGTTDDRNYQAACEGLAWEAYKAGILQESPCYWHRQGIPGSGGDQWFRKDVEYVLCFKGVAKLPWSDNTAAGFAPVCEEGGEFSNRKKTGERANRVVMGQMASNRRNRDGTRLAHDKRYAKRLAKYQTEGFTSNPGNRLVIPDDEYTDEWPSSMFSTGAGGGGSIRGWARESEAPYPEALPEFFIPALCPPNGLVCDPFSGSGTTAAVAERLGRNAIGFDLRLSQCRIARKRIDRPHSYVKKRSGQDVRTYELFDKD